MATLSVNPTVECEPWKFVHQIRGSPDWLSPDIRVGRSLGSPALYRDTEQNQIERKGIRRKSIIGKQKNC